MALEMLHLCFMFGAAKVGIARTSAVKEIDNIMYDKCKECELIKGGGTIGTK